MKKNTSLMVFLTFCFLFLHKTSEAQVDKLEDITESKSHQIDSIFTPYHGENSAGYAVGIVKDGNLIFSKGYGYANLDYNVPLSDSSAFYIGSMAKQFTAAALLILEQQGKIDFDERIDFYLSDFPIYDTDNPITINHLVHHTSGIRETNSMQLFQGIDTKFEEVFTTDDLYSLVISQRGLNFLTGSEYRYSSGGYAVLAKLIEKVSGKSLRTFLKKNIFDKLEMHNTFVCDNHNEVIPNRAVSYFKTKNQNWERRSLVFDAYGDGGIITTVKDLAKWDKAFYEDILGVENFAKKMYQKGVLNNGKMIDYARALNVWKYKDLPVVQHNGGMLGFRVDMVRFPEQNFSVIVLGNAGHLHVTREAFKVADIFLENNFKEAPPQIEKTIPAYEASFVRKLRSRAGYYWTDQMNYYRRISFQNDSLFIDSGSEYKNLLYPLSENEFLIMGSEPESYVTFFPKKDSLAIQFGDIKRSFRKFDPTPPKNIDELRFYEGSYYNTELNTTYNLSSQNNKLYLTINGKSASTLQLFPVPKDKNVVWNGKQMVWIGFAEIKFDFTDGKVQGFNIGDSRVSNIYFIKQQK